MKQSEYAAHVRLWQKKAEELDETLGTLPPEVGTYLEGEMALLVGDMTRVMGEINNDGESNETRIVGIEEQIRELEQSAFIEECVRIVEDGKWDQWRGRYASELFRDLETISDRLTSIAFDYEKQGIDAEPLFNLNDDLIMAMVDVGYEEE